MRMKIMQWLVCPACGGELNLKVFASHAEEIMEGELHCHCGEWYPVIHGVPRLLLGDMRVDIPLLYPDFYHAYQASKLGAEMLAIRLCLAQGFTGGAAVCDATAFQ